MNVCSLMGRLCEAPELKTTTNGASVTSFTLAVERGYTTPDGERVSDFIRCVAWRQTAELVVRHFRRGQRMAVQGMLRSRRYTGKDGDKRTAYEIVVERVYFCESRPAPVATEEPTADVADVADEDLPF